MNPARIVVFTADPSYSVRKGIVDIDEALPGLQWLVLWHAPSKSVRQLLKNQRANWKRNGWRWIPYQLGDIAQRLLARPERPASDAAPGKAYTLAALRSRPNLRLLRVDDLHGQAALDEVRQFSPRLGLSLAAPILRQPLFDLPELGTLNLHKGKVPEFRGMPPAFWEFWTDKSSVGCTVHQVDAKLDTGDIVAETSLPRAPRATVRGMQLQLDESGCDLMRKAVTEVLAGRAVPTPQSWHAGATYRKPTLTQLAEMRRRERPHQAFGATGARQFAKDLAARAAFQGLTGLAWPRLAPRLTVLLYHRVTDDVRDNLSVGVAQFERQMALLRQHCQLVSLDQALAMTEVPRSDLPLVAVSFDDGYLDNYALAAPVLRRHGVPAAFFVSTGIMDSDQPFPHDVRRGNGPLPVMNWDQLRQMRDWGFTIGSHTVNHIDCAAEPESVVWEELLRSRDDIQRELGLDQVVLAYPYGGRQHMTPQRLDLVRKAGYVGCLSAHGGSNLARVDRFNVLRRGINWEFSDRAFLYECLGR